MDLASVWYSPWGGERQEHVSAHGRRFRWRRIEFKFIGAVKYVILGVPDLVDVQGHND